MSRIGNAPISLPDGVTVSASGNDVQVKGPKGALSASIPSEIALEVDSGVAKLKRPSDKKSHRALHGLARALVNNMVVGVTQGFAKELEIHGVGYRADVKGKVLNLALGFSHPVAMDVPEGLKVSVEANTKLRIEGMDKALVGQFAADVRSLRPPEPYKGKGIRYSDEHVRRKVGKAGAS
ncbi:MAG: 50S ribosomal protein L6 [Proteobacteria bacterium]|nr:50S ribosomal protein L6 [Pseudomonadota bacterium]